MRQKIWLWKWPVRFLLLWQRCHSTWLPYHHLDIQRHTLRLDTPKTENPSRSIYPPDQNFVWLRCLQSTKWSWYIFRQQYPPSMNTQKPLRHILKWDSRFWLFRRLGHQSRCHHLAISFLWSCTLKWDQLRLWSYCEPELTLSYNRSSYSFSSLNFTI